VAHEWRTHQLRVERFVPDAVGAELKRYISMNPARPCTTYWHSREDWMKWSKGVATHSSSRRSSDRYVAIAAVLAIFSARAQDNEPPPLIAHEHGVAKLTVILQGQRLAFEFDAPAVNLTGFEYAPQSETEQRTASYAKGQLQQAFRLFLTSPGANCRLFSAKVDEPTWNPDVEHHDYRGRYVFQCQRPQLLQTIDVRLVNQLTPGTKLRTQLLVGNGRQSVELSERQATLRIPR
jgi:hypothetical protein